MEPSGKQAAERRFAGAAQPDQSDPPMPRLAIPQCKMRIEQGARFAEAVRRQPPQQLDDWPQFGRVVRLATNKPGQRQVQRVGDAAQQLDRNIAFAAFELREITLRESGIASK